jgi:hypothetical protein
MDLMNEYHLNMRDPLPLKIEGAGSIRHVIYIKDSDGEE